MTIGQHLVAAVTDQFVLGGILLLLALHLAHARTWRGALRLLAAVAVAWAASHALKLLVDDPRPAGGVVDAWGSGWPSGHAAVAAAAALSLWGSLSPGARTRLGRVALGAGLLALALSVAWTRLYLGVHDLGDVVGGLAVGLLVGYSLRARR